MKTRIPAVVAALAATLLLTVGTPTAEAASPQASLKKAVKTYTTSLLTGHGAKAYGYLAPRCKKQVTKADFVALGTYLKQTYGNPPMKSYSAKIKGSKARVNYAYGNPDLDTKNESWVKKSGHWKFNGC